MNLVFSTRDNGKAVRHDPSQWYWKRLCNIEIQVFLWSHKHNINKVFVQVITLQEDGCLRILIGERLPVMLEMFTHPCCCPSMSPQNTLTIPHKISTLVWIQWNENHVTLVGGVAGAYHLMWGASSRALCCSGSKMRPCDIRFKSYIEVLLLKFLFHPFQFKCDCVSINYNPHLEKVGFEVGIRVRGFES